jgi:hypothetical protein
MVVAITLRKPPPPNHGCAIRVVLTFGDGGAESILEAREKSYT